MFCVTNSSNGDSTLGEPSPRFGVTKQVIFLESTSTPSDAHAPMEPTTSSIIEGDIYVHGFTSDLTSAAMTSFPLVLPRMCLFDFCLGFTVIQSSKVTQGANLLS